ncbi:rod shape-determining protein MreC [Gayadomonas joobiniege]|uniref:rod shape-determining protein MreC n=1 Tax=Gayadomonas joobiniege TaxID=1234606 RepID=UPI000361330D|nr:rod shape-determining protein MreC [Gayadomonas joobiniege]
MTPLFANGPALQTRALFAVLLAFVVMFLDHRVEGFDRVRPYLNSVVSPIIYAANFPQKFFNWSSESLSSRSDLLAENQRLRESYLVLNERIQRMEFIQRENDRLRALLDSPLRQDFRKMVTEVMAVENNPTSHQLVLNRGIADGVFEGQPVLDENGIVGQITEVSRTTSRVLLITDHTHAIPVRIERNQVRSIAVGSGSLSRLELAYVPHSTDIREGDILLSSGLGQRYPEGYPVAQVTSVISNEGQRFARIIARPFAQLDRVRYLLLLWPPQKRPTDKHQTPMASGVK